MDRRVIVQLRRNVDEMYRRIACSKETAERARVTLGRARLRLGGSPAARLPNATREGSR